LGIIALCVPTCCLTFAAALLCRCIVAAWRAGWTILLLLLVLSLEPPAFGQWTTNVGTNVAGGSGYTGTTPATNSGNYAFKTNTFGTNATGSYGFKTNTFGTNAVSGYSPTAIKPGTNATSYALNTNAPGSARFVVTFSTNQFLITNSIIIAGAGNSAVNATYWLNQNGWYTNTATASNVLASGGWYIYWLGSMNYSNTALVGPYASAPGGIFPDPTVTAGTLITNDVVITNQIPRF
jgi:hypothetical protein